MAELTIGRLATRAGVGVETIRYYERRGLLSEPPRSPAGYRLYGEDDVKRLSLLRTAKYLGFKLEEKGELLELRVDSRANCREVERRAAEVIERVARQIAELEGIPAGITGSGLGLPASRAHGSVSDIGEHRGGVLMKHTPDIELVFFEGCPNAGTARERLRAALEEAGLEREWTEWNVDDPGTPEERRGFGSPTVLIDGRDVLGTTSRAAGRSCRAEGAPSVDAIVQQLRSAR